MEIICFLSVTTGGEDVQKQTSAGESVSLIESNFHRPAQDEAARLFQNHNRLKVVEYRKRPGRS